MDTSAPATTATDWTGRHLLTVPETAQLLGLGRSSAYDACRKGDLPTVHLNGRVYVPVSKLRALLGIESES